MKDITFGWIFLKSSVTAVMHLSTHSTTNGACSTKAFSTDRWDSFEDLRADCGATPIGKLTLGLQVREELLKVNIVRSGKVLAQKYVEYRSQARQRLFLLLHLAVSTLTA